ncbi:MAG: hypothetical protein WEB13_00930 [Dehalococcoidia bacterium]
MRVRHVLGILVLLGTGVMLLSPLAAFGAPPDSATVRFGSTSVGSPDARNGPPFGDASTHALDRMRPRTAVIAAGGTVDFEVDGFHQVVVYQVGKGLDDVDLSGGTPLLINDFAGAIAVGTLPFAASDISVTFMAPGKYLVICNVRPHLVENGQYGWVDVK